MGTRKGHFVQIPNEIVRSNRISLAAKGLYAYICSERRGWEFTYKKMKAETRAGHDAIRNALDELLDAGLIICGPRARKKDGKMGGCTYIPTQQLGPSADNPSADNPSVDNPSVDDPSVDDPSMVDQMEKKKIKKNNINKKTSTVLPAEVMKRYEEMYGVKLTAAEAGVLGKYAEMGTDVCILALVVAAERKADRPAYYAGGVLREWQAQGCRTAEDVLRANPWLVPQQEAVSRPDARELERMMKLREKLRGGISSGDGVDNTGEEG